MAYPSIRENATDVIIRPVVFTIGLALGAAAQAYAQLSTPAPAPQQAPQPAATATPEPTQVPSQAPTPAATATPASPYKYVVEPTPNPSAQPWEPAIVRIELNDQTLHPGGQLAVRVTTNSATLRVFASAEGQNMEIPRTQDGTFAGTTTLPGFIPPWFFKTYQVIISAYDKNNWRVVYPISINLAH